MNISDFLTKTLKSKIKRFENWYIVESFLEMFYFKVKFAKSIWNFHWYIFFLEISPFDLTNTTSTVENFT